MKPGDTALLPVHIVHVGSTLALVRLPLSQSMAPPSSQEVIVPIQGLIPGSRIPTDMIALREANCEIERLKGAK